MPDRTLAPIMIGVTGKRDVHGNDDAVRKAIDACFDVLDRHLPASGKLLLTGLAAGADTIAAEVALKRDWKVIAILPFALDLFAQDFDAAAAERLRSLIAPGIGKIADTEHGRVIVLNPLIDPKTDRPFPVERISHHGDVVNPDRSDHYEQVGLMIADCCALMIAVMPASEKPGRIGGTARIATFRVHGTLDDNSERVRRQSQVLRKPPELDTPQRGPLWVIDLDAVDDDAESRMKCVQIWEEETPTSIKRTQWIDEDESIGDLSLARRLDAFNKMSKAVGNQKAKQSVKSMAKTDRHWKMEEDEQARKDLGDATSSLRKIRHALSVIQGDNKKKLQHTVITLTAFFILAVMAVELHILSENKFTIIGYFLLLLAIVVVFRLAKYRILQQYYEDYRAVAEALRVQCAWWDAGLNKPEHRVDRTYLCGAAGSLALVRAGIRHLIDAAFLEKASPIANKADVKNWIEAQRDYFETRTGERGGQMLRFERAIWFLFDASLGMALSSIPLALLLANTDGALSSFVAPIDKLLMNTPGLWFLATLMLVIATVVMFMRALNSGQANPARHIRKRRWTFEHSNIVRGFVAGILMAIAVYIFVAGAHPFDGPVSHFVTHHMSACSGHGDLDKIHCSHNLAHNLTITMMIILASSAGALRFYSERLAMESELHAYREALEVFRRAENVLIVNQTPVSAERYDSIVLELGMQALKESESWIRAHRVRPLEPHV